MVTNEMGASDAPARGTHFLPSEHSTFTYRFLKGLVASILRIWLRPVKEGPGSIPDHGAVIITPVHRSNLDFAFSILLTKRKVFWMAKDSLWKWKWFGRFLLAMGAFPVHRESADRSALNHAEAVLELGQVLVMFPEGTRQSGPLIGDIFEGASYLAARTGAAIVPLGIGGSARAMPKGAKFPRPTQVRLYLGDVLQPPMKNEKGRVSRSTVHEATQELHTQLQDAFDRASS
jgi:1-acyl-sn-glycerol-3-phosphate acyltransferase